MITENQLFLKKVTGDDTKKTKRWTEIQVFTKVTHLFKPINY